MMFKVIVAAALVACTLAVNHTATKTEAEIVAAYKTSKCAADFGVIVAAAGNATAAPAVTEPAAAGNATAAPAATEPAATTAATGGSGSGDGSADGSGATKPVRSRRAAHAASCKALVAEYKTILGCSRRSRRAGHAVATCALLKTAEEAVDQASAPATTTAAAGTTIAATESSASTLAAGFSAAVAVAVAQLC